MFVCACVVSVALGVAGVGLAQAGPGSTDPRAVGNETAPANAVAAAGEPEVTSEVGDLWRDRDAFYLRVDGRTPREAGVAPAGSRVMIVRLEAMTRGRPWPGRWTMVEVEVRSAEPQPLDVSFAPPSAPPAQAEVDRVVAAVSLPGVGSGGKGAWTRLRLAMPATPRDLVLRAGGAAGTAGRLEFRRVRFVDDRRTYWSDGWGVVREAGWLRVRPGKGAAFGIPLGAASGVRLAEVGRLRVLLTSEATPGVGAAIYADGRVSVSASGPAGGGGVAPVPEWLRALTERAGALQPGGAGLAVELSDDVGRVERGSAGDADADGFNEARGALMLRAVEGTRRLTLRLLPVAGAVAPGSPAVLEIADLPPGEVTVLWQGRVLKSHDRVPPPSGSHAADSVSASRPSSVLIVMPEAVAGPTEVEVSVSARP